MAYIENEFSSYLSRPSRLRDGAVLELQSLSDSCQRAQELVLTASFLQQVQVGWPLFFRKTPS